MSGLAVRAVCWKYIENESVCACCRLSKLQGRALLHGHEVPVEEVRIQRGLHHTTEPWDPRRVVRLSVRSVDPVEDVQSAVRAQSGDIVPCNVLDILVSSQQHQLGKNGNSFQEQ